MHGGQIFVLIIIAMALVAGIVKARYRYQHRDRDSASALAGAESQQLRDEVRQLKERIQVLERITVEKENSLSREIEELRSRP
ncbi:MAG TPA: hypothetical protein VM913_07975 [Sphingomicrobium sp.]|jgi:type II secretory pathway pseudopilin PulG|nr:hypothetical protein [Sphingomicrobium sp.]